MTQPEEEYTEPDYTVVIGKPATPLQRRMAEWIRSPEVGYDPTTAKSKLEAFEEGVRIAVAHRMSYQASDHNRNATAVEREERAALAVQRAADREAERVRRAEERAAKAAAAPVAEEAPAAPAAKAAKATRPAKAAKAAPAAATPAPAATRPAPRRAPARRAAPAAPAAGGDAPF